MLKKSEGPGRRKIRAAPLTPSLNNRGRAS